MKVLVVGGCGYIGDCVAEELVSMGHDVSVVDKLLYTDAYLRPNVKFYNYDVLSEDFMDFLGREKFESIIHLAAIVGDGACKIDPQLTVDTNEGIVKDIVSYIYFFRPSTRLIFASTSSVYGDNDSLLNENSEVRPLSLYAGTKLNAEKYIEHGVLDSFVIFRLGTLFGMSTPFARIRADLVANILTFKACDNEPLQIFGGEQWRPLISVKDVGRIFAESVDADYNGKFVLSHRNYKIIDIANTIIGATGSTSELTITDAKFEDLRNYKVDNRKALKNGIMAYISLEDGVKELADIYRSGRIKNVWNSNYHNAKYIKEYLK